jgi:hypothetical protein
MWSATANAGTVLQFDQTNPADTVTGTESGGVTTLSTTGNMDGGFVSIAVTITNFLGTPGLDIPAFETFVNVHSTAAAVPGLVEQQAFTGTIEITGGIGGTGPNFLTATFTDSLLPAVMVGFAGGNQLSLNNNNPPQSMVFTSDFAPLGTPLSMTIGFSNVNPLVHLSNGSIGSFTGQNSGTFGANTIPEPASFGMGLAGIIFVTLFARSRRQRAPRTKV